MCCTLQHACNVCNVWRNENISSSSELLFYYVKAQCGDVSRTGIVSKTPKLHKSNTPLTQSGAKRYLHLAKVTFPVQSTFLRWKVNILAQVCPSCDTICDFAPPKPLGREKSEKVTKEKAGMNKNLQERENKTRSIG